MSQAWLYVLSPAFLNALPTLTLKCRVVAFAASWTNMTPVGHWAVQG